MSKNAKKILAVVLLLVVIAAAVFAYFQWGPPAQKPVEGAKTVTVEVVHKDESRKEFVIHTDAETLRGALEQEKLIEGTESEWGLYVLTVDGETADEAAQEWWCFNDGEGNMLPTGVDSTMIQDGDKYEIVLTVGW